MDAERFDRLSRQIAGQADRRSIFKVAAGAALALVGAGVARREASADGFEGDVCFSGDDCREGLVCQGASSGLLGGSLAGIPYGPGVPIPLTQGSSGRCRYHNEGCGREGQVCKNNDDCCSGFSCPNNRCRRQ